MWLILSHWQDSGPCYSSVNIKRHDGTSFSLSFSESCRELRISSHIQVPLIWSWYRNIQLARPGLGFWRSPAFGYSVAVLTYFFSTTGNECPSSPLFKINKEPSCSFPEIRSRFLLLSFQPYPEYCQGPAGKNAESVFRNPILIAAHCPLGGLICSMPIEPARRIQAA